METVLGVSVTVRTERNTLVETSDLMVTTTPSREPLIEADCVRQGTHTTARGSDQAEKNEFTPEPDCRIQRLRFMCLNNRLGWNWEVFLRSDF